MKQITQEEFEKLLDPLAQQKKGLSKDKKLSLAEFLKANGFLPTLDNLKFSVTQKAVTQTPVKNADGSIVTVTQVLRRTSLFTDLDFTGLTSIKNCNFDTCDLSGGIFENLKIENCSLNDTVVNNAQMDNLIFSSTKFKGTSFDYSHLQNITFKECPMSLCSLNNLGTLDFVIWQNCPMSYITIVGGAKASDITMQATDRLRVRELLTDKTIKFDQIIVDKKQPTILVSWNNSAPGIAATLAEKMLRERQLNPINMDYCPPVNEKVLDAEVAELSQLAEAEIQQLKNAAFVKFSAQNTQLSALEIFQAFPEYWKTVQIGFPMLMIKLMRELHSKDQQKFPQMSAIYAYAQSMFEQVDGVLIPGGQDIDPRFYGKPLDPKTQLPKYPNSELFDARRDALEFSLVYIQQSASKPKPLCGICRGSQVIAASYGASMYQDLGDPKRAGFLVECFAPKAISADVALFSTQHRLNANSRREALKVIYVHHQGYNLDAACGLKGTASIKVNDLCIDTVGENLDQNICMTQAHPEFAFDKVEGSESGFGSKVSALAADGIFGHFEMRVRAYIQNQLFHQIALTTSKIGIFKTEKKDHAVAKLSPNQTLTSQQ
ncbi:gamma-glutamyl-gamma-aminobutyrate hydrolase family protein [Legionella waltersii]|uniref:gamma-glutamyl-gamma-aminobutyrate hydrolase family protein n=1 Tax=Legionella waltersii TaxID=66969 RepID=UPI00138F70F7|nr:gamma-glutamyl-gamma-aminobutyrate hydrolase family protein [Legionella waltersii]